MVTLIEWLVGIAPLLLIAAATKKADLFASWSFAQVLILFLVPAAVLHWVVLCRYLKLQIGPAP